MLEHSPPHSLDAESGVLGALLLDPRMCDDVALILTAEDFYSPAHRTVFGHVLDMHASGSRVDLALLIERLKTAGDLDAVGGMPFLVGLAEASPTAAAAIDYGRIVASKAEARGVITCATELLRDACDPSVRPRELLGQAQQRLSDLADRRSTNDLVTAADVVGQAVEALGERSDRGVPTGLPILWSALDRLVGGLRPGQLVIVGARPRVGKTSFALNLLEHVAGFSQPVLFVSLEMTRLELGDRLLSSRSGVPLELIRRGTKNSDNRRAIIEAQAELAPLPIIFDDAPRRTIADIAAQARRVKRRSGLALLVIDYLQLIEPDNVRDQRQEQVAKMARRLKTLARELLVPIVCLAQLNREADKAADHKPRLSHLRESGAIEQDADVVILLHRESLYRDDPDLRGKAEAIVAKNRNGRAGTVPLIWNDATTTFVSTPDDFDAGPTEHQDEFEFF